MDDLQNGLPRASLDRALAVAEAIVKEGRSLTRMRIAVALGVKAGTGSANTRTIAARKFGLIRSDPSGGYAVTDLGRRLLRDPSNVQLRRSAIIGVEGFSRLKDYFDTDLSLVAREDLSRALVEFGISAPRASEAARIFERSWMSGDPTNDTEDAASDHPMPAAEVPARAPTDKADHPVLSQILAQLPQAGQGWAVSERDAWIDLFSSAVRFVYPATGGSGGSGH